MQAGLHTHRRRSIRSTNEARHLSRRWLQTASQSSREFGELRRRRDARGNSDAAKILLHPDVGELTLRMQTFDVRSCALSGAARGPGRHEGTGSSLQRKWRRSGG
ncbi:hypothetical protein [Streptomyces sp. ID05-39B]|uniref:MmyB family transcriptional regulator n=1 Tax=Streptomyces sp. ID05-39B TaxID=3028664 RepID=UPI0034DB3A12